METLFVCKTPTFISVRFKAEKVLQAAPVATVGHMNVSQFVIQCHTATAVDAFIGTGFKEEFFCHKMHLSEEDNQYIKR